MRLFRLRLALFVIRMTDRLFPIEPETGPYWPMLPPAPTATAVSRRLARQAHAREGGTAHV